MVRTATRQSGVRPGRARRRWPPAPGAMSCPCGARGGNKGDHLPRSTWSLATGHTGLSWPHEGESARMVSAAFAGGRRSTACATASLSENHQRNGLPRFWCAVVGIGGNRSTLSQCHLDSKNRKPHTTWMPAPITSRSKGRSTPMHRGQKFASAPPRSRVTASPHRSAQAQTLPNNFFGCPSRPLTDGYLLNLDSQETMSMSDLKT